MIGYDDIASVQYFGKNLKAYWKKNIRRWTPHWPMPERIIKNMQRCDEWDYKVIEDAVEAGGQRYAELCAASYRQAISAHKLVCGPAGELFFFSKENNKQRVYRYG